MPLPCVVAAGEKHSGDNRFSVCGLFLLGSNAVCLQLMGKDSSLSARKLRQVMKDNQFLLSVLRFRNMLHRWQPII
jgi:hypothetical protein